MKKIGSILLILVTLGCIGFFLECNRTKPSPFSFDPHLRDTLAEFGYQYYLWNTNLIAASNQGTFNIANFSYSDTLTQETNAIKQTSDLIKGTSIRKDKDGFSRTTTYAAALAESSNNATSFGIDAFVDLEDANSKWRIKYVAKTSPAYAKGIRRGWILNSINGKVAARTSEFIGYFFNTLFFGGPGFTTINLNLTDPSTNISQNISLTSSSVKEDEVTYSSVINTGNSKVGYIVYHTFLLESQKHPELDAAFATFASQGITDIIIDLRDNGGGFTKVSDAMTSALLQSKHPVFMYTTAGNDTLRKYLPIVYPEGYRATFDTLYADDITRDGTPQLSVNNIVFIVNYGTASASELVMNAVSPHITTKMVCLGRGFSNGFGQSTAGKPFGGFGFDYPYQAPVLSSYLLSFESKNSKGEDDYYLGFSPGLQLPGVQAFDGISHDWGDPQESGLSAALGLLGNTIVLSNTHNALAISGKDRFNRQVGLDIIPPLHQGRMIKTIQGHGMHYFHLKNLHKR